MMHRDVSVHFFFSCYVSVGGCVCVCVCVNIKLELTTLIKPKKSFLAIKVSFLLNQIQTKFIVTKIYELKN